MLVISIASSMESIVMLLLFLFVFYCLVQFWFQFDVGLVFIAYQQAIHAEWVVITSSVCLSV